MDKIGFFWLVDDDLGSLEEEVSREVRGVGLVRGLGLRMGG